jgi:DNA (cytosine-5)-methyltransferase 1
MVDGLSARLDGPYGWAQEPEIPRVARGVQARVDRLHGLGNAVVPEIPYRLGRAILTADVECNHAEAA